MDYNNLLAATTQYIKHLVAIRRFKLGNFSAIIKKIKDNSTKKTTLSCKLRKS